MKQIFIKQKPSPAAIYYGLNQYGTKKGEDGVSVNPGARQSFGVRTETDGDTWVTGLNEESPRIMEIANDKERAAKQTEIKKLREKLERQLGKDLSAHSDFWLTYRMELVEKGNFKKALDLDKPEDLLLYTVALENRVLAKEFSQLQDPQYTAIKAFLYVYDPQTQITRKAIVQEFKDEIGYLFYSNRQDADKLFYWGAALNKGVNRGMTRSQLYSLLSSHVETLKTPEDYEDLLKILRKDNEELQYIYLFRLGIRKKVINRSKGLYVYKENELGKNEAEVVSYLGDSRNADVLESLMLLDPQFT